MGYSGHLSFKGESFYEYIRRTWDEWHLPARDQVVAEFHDVNDAVIYIAGRQNKNGAVVPYVVKDGGESEDNGEVYRMARCFSEDEDSVYAFPPEWFLRLLTPAAANASAVRGHWRETAALNARWRPAIVAEVAKADVGDFVEVQQTKGGSTLAIYAVLDEQHQMEPIEGHFWPGLAAVIAIVAKGGVVITHKKGTWTPPPGAF